MFQHQHAWFSSKFSPLSILNKTFIGEWLGTINFILSIHATSLIIIWFLFRSIDLWSRSKQFLIKCVCVKNATNICLVIKWKTWVTKLSQKKQIKVVQDEQFIRSLNNRCGSTWSTVMVLCFSGFQYSTS